MSKFITRRALDFSGVIRFEDSPIPDMEDHEVLIKTEYSLISAGTESSTLSKSPIGLAKQASKDSGLRNQVTELLTSEGLSRGMHRIKDELLLPRPIGYSGSGVAIKVGADIKDIKPGDRVAFATGGHAETVVVGSNHVTKIPEGVHPKDACFITVGAIALHGIRRAEVSIGEKVAVIGQGLVGQLTTQLIKAAGAHPIGIDINDSRLEDSSKFGAVHVINSFNSNPVTEIMRFTGGTGVDKTIICANGDDASIANQAMEMTRKQGKVCFVGIVPMNLERMPFFLNELDLVFSRAYGPGSYDENYEMGKTAYPSSYIRWDEKENLQEFLNQISIGNISVDSFINETVLFDEAEEAFKSIMDKARNKVAIILSYKDKESKELSEIVHNRSSSSSKEKLQIGFIGVGKFIRGYHLKTASENKKVSISAICSKTGVTAKSLSKRYDTNYSTSNYKEIFEDENIDAVVIGTRHNTHEILCLEALENRKSVFCEKPLSLSLSGLKNITKEILASDTKLMLGYNRSHHKFVHKINQDCGDDQMIINITMNIHPIPNDHWTLDPEMGGGRLIGEADHFIDLAASLTLSQIEEVYISSLNTKNSSLRNSLNFVLNLNFKNGSIANITYSDNASNHSPREKVEVICSGKTFEIIDFKQMKILGSKNRIIKSSDKGHVNCFNNWIDWLENNKDFSSLSAINSSLASLAGLESLKTKSIIRLPSIQTLIDDG